MPASSIMPRCSKRGDRTFYVASKSCHAWMWLKLRDEGVPIIATWLDEAGAGASTDLEDLAKRSIQEASQADVTVVYCEPSEMLKEALIEVGAALACGREVRVVGRCRNLSGVFTKHPLWRTYATLTEAFQIKSSMRREG